MQLESFYEDYESEISDGIFDDVFEDQYETNFDNELQSDPPSNRYFENRSESSFDQHIESLVSELDGLNLEEAQDHIAEIAPALIPLFTALVPLAIKATKGIANKLSKRKSSKPSQPRSNKQPHSKKAPHLRSIHANQRHQHSKCNCQGQASNSQLGQRALGTLTSLLNNKGVQTFLSSLVKNGDRQTIKLGNSETIAHEGALLNAIAYLAKEAQYEISDDQYPDAMEYLIGPDGDFMADPESSESKALRFIELFNN